MGLICLLSSTLTLSIFGLPTNPKANVTNDVCFYLQLLIYLVLYCFQSFTVFRIPIRRHPYHKMDAPNDVCAMNVEHLHNEEFTFENVILFCESVKREFFPSPANGFNRNHIDWLPLKRRQFWCRFEFSSLFRLLGFIYVWNYHVRTMNGTFHPYVSCINNVLVQIAS